MASPPPPDLEEYAAAATVTPFPRPLPLLRVPIPSSGPHLLAFKTPAHWTAAFQSCRAHLTSQCESGVRIGCSVSSSARCKPPWWKTLISPQQHDSTERAKCEEAEMEACLAAARARCGEFAERKCGPAFGDARVEVRGGGGEVSYVRGRDLLGADEDYLIKRR